MIAIAPVLSRLSGLALVAVLGWLAIAVDISPLSGAARDWSLPDALFLILACLVLRRPALVPLPLVFALGLLRDLLAGAAVGVGALGLVVGIEILRTLAPRLRHRSLVMEWLQVVGVAAVALMVPVLLLWMSLADVPAFPDLAGRLIATAAGYPVAVALLRVGHARPRPEVEGRAP